VSALTKSTIVLGAHQGNDDAGPVQALRALSIARESRIIPFESRPTGKPGFDETTERRFA
jgi:hypothetical protein